jgi:hypothetical protein
MQGTGWCGEDCRKTSPTIPKCSGARAPQRGFEPSRPWDRTHLACFLRAPMILERLVRLEPAFDSQPAGC